MVRDSPMTGKYYDLGLPGLAQVREVKKFLFNSFGI
jgi:hypothetical protein